MTDKRTTVEEMVGELRDGMTVGIGGWGSRRKPMAAVRAICRSGLSHLTVVAYGGPDVGLLCATGKAAKVVCGFVTLDSIPLDPHWRAARQQGQVALSELDEGLFYLGLQAAAWRVPFLPSRSGLGSDVLVHNPQLRTIRSPYEQGSLAGLFDTERDAGTTGTTPNHAGRRDGGAAPDDDAGAELVAMPAIHLDAAFVHVNRADTTGNAQVLAPDPFFDELFLAAATRRFVTAERIVDAGQLATEAPLASITIHRLLTDAVATTPNGAHFTACPPDYGRDEGFQKEYVASAKDPGAWAAFRARYLDVDEREYHSAVAERSKGAA